MFWKSKKTFKGSRRLNQQHAAISQYLADIDPKVSNRIARFEMVNSDYSVEDLRQLLKALYERIDWLFATDEALGNHMFNPGEAAYEQYSPLAYLAEAILSRSIYAGLKNENLLSTDDLLAYLTRVNNHSLNVFHAHDILQNLLRELSAQGPISDSVFDAAMATFARVELRREIIVKREEMIYICGRGSPPFVYAADSWGAAVRSELTNMQGDLRSNWKALLAHCQLGYSGKPTKKWTSAAQELLSAIGKDNARPTFIHWFELVADQRNHSYPGLHLRNEDILRGMLKCTPLIHDDRLSRAVGKLAIECFRRVRHEYADGCEYRQLSPTLGSTAVHALSEIASDSALTSLLQVQAFAHTKSARYAIQKALTALSEKRGMSKDELQEISVPTFGLQTVGHMQSDFEEVSATLTLHAEGKTSLLWTRSDGSHQKTPPKLFKEQHPEVVKELNQARKDIEGMASVQARRLESLYRKNSIWPFEVWRTRYLLHPLVGVLTQNLLWEFLGTADRVVALRTNDGLIDEAGAPVDMARLAHNNVRLWHPCSAISEREVIAWREFIQEHGIVQPFKQAHRELYIPTPAEEESGFISRFSGHVLRQGVLRSLCDARHWRYQLRVVCDDLYKPPSLDLEDFEVRAEFYVNCMVEDPDALGSTIAVVSSGDLVFYPIDSDQKETAIWRPIDQTMLEKADVMPLATLSPVILSETMRDIDLFIATASIGLTNSSQIPDEGDDFYISIEQTDVDIFIEQTKMRSELLDWLIPRLEISEQLQVEGKYLLVRGIDDEFRIHLVTGNVFSTTANVQLDLSEKITKKQNVVTLPFRGDNRLADILAKAHVLAKTKVEVG